MCLQAPFGLVFGGRLGDPRARHSNRGSGFARARKESQAMIVGSISLEALGGAAAAWPLAVHAQQSAMPMVGFVTGLSSNYVTGLAVSAFGQTGH